MPSLSARPTQHRRRKTIRDRQPGTHRRHLQLEALEDRRLLAVGFMNSAGAAGGFPDGFSLAF